MATKVKSDAKSASAPTTGRWVLVGSGVVKAPAGVVVCRNSSQLQSVVRETPKTKKRVYITYLGRSADDLVREGMKLGRGARMGNLLTLEPPRPESVASLSALFERVIGAIPGYAWLPKEEVPTVVSAKDAADRFIGGAVDVAGKTVSLVRGDLSMLVVPFSHFKASGDGTKPNFSKPSFSDYGMTVAFGGYEASADGILYEFDPVYRQKLKKERQASEKSFGASLRRLRLQRRLKRGDFAPVAAKTIARIERGDVERPQGKTLEAIEKKLGMNAEQIESY